ncbi:serine/threonine protein kinase YAK1 [Sugiyamaella lignohabitans]|uniref:Serine/threonine protein kinase YAK1 n=1 Tax=Sugiyamaella lignohabitans TaxID=796027 RepID=A0A161HI61_9ASCO|nr:serine/threonine protein kinase YAK1 [Sugiyamaella lignohabitans]ANB15940.1 serine/threonine protein kinase YAK1 [Sugiyamaella lignohabitans]
MKRLLTIDRYLVLDILGQGTFGQVVKCQNMYNKEIVAVKVIKNKPAYLNQSMMEVSILEHLNTYVDKNDEHNLLRLKDRFMHKEHLCLVFELLSSNLYELIRQNQFHGLSTNLVRVFAQQLLDSLTVLKESRLIHCDLKPENILLKSLDSPVIKVIDFGSACHERQTVYTYIQSRFYRSPEVILGLPYTTSIDMWSLGCIVAELFLGLPIFPGTSEYNQLCRITETLGNPPNWMIEMGKNSGQFMEKYIDEFGRKQYRLKSREKYSREFNCDEQPSKRYFPSTNLREIIRDYRLPRQNMSKEEIDREMQNRLAFVDFVQGLLNLNPFERWTPQQAAMHPFITESKFVGPFVPSSVVKGPTPVATPPPPQQNQQQQQQQLPTQMQPQVQPQPSHQLQAPLQPLQSQPLLPIQAQPVISGARSNKLQPEPVNTGHHVVGSNTYYNNNIGTNGDARQHALQHQAQQTQHQAQAKYLETTPSIPHQHQEQKSHYHPPHNQATRRQRATTIGQLDAIPGPIQRATALMNPTNLIRAQPSPAYIPPPDIYAMHGGGPNVGSNLATASVLNSDGVNTGLGSVHHGDGQSKLREVNQQNPPSSNQYEVVRNLEDGLSYMS